MLTEQGLYEPLHDKTNKITCAPGEYTNQPGHPPGLISVFGQRIKKHWGLRNPLSDERRLWSEWADVQADLSLRWAHIILLFFFMLRLILLCQRLEMLVCWTDKTSQSAKMYTIILQMIVVTV